MKTLEQVKAEFEAEGLTFKDWANAKGYKLRNVYAVLAGDLKCSRGESHKIAVALGLKAKPKGELRAA